MSPWDATLASMLTDKGVRRRRGGLHRRRNVAEESFIMAQTSFAFDDLPIPVQSAVRRALPAADLGDLSFQAGYAIGWDHARHGLVPPVRHLLPGHPVRQGWQAGRPAFARRTLATHAGVQRWLALRLQAWEQNLAFEDLQVTPHFLNQIAVARCPVSREPLPALTGQVVRLNQAAGYAAGNLAMVAARVARALHGLDLAGAGDAAFQARAAADGLYRQLSAAEWERLAALMSLATPLSPAQAAARPLRTLPPNRVRLLNPVQGLQAWITLQIELDGWSRRINRFATLLPEAARPAFRVFVGGLLPRVWLAGRPADAQALHERLEDAWADERVIRRWQRLALALDAEQIEGLLEAALSLGLSGRRVHRHAAACATEGWALDSRGRPGSDSGPQGQFSPRLCKKLSTASV